MTSLITTGTSVKKINEILREDPSSCEVTCPLNLDKDTAIVQTGEEWAELAVLTFFNMCTDKELDKDETIRLCNTIMFGMGPTDDPRDSISLDEVVSNEKTLAMANSTEDETCFPRFDLSKLSSCHMTLGERLKEPSGGLRRMFVKRYRAVFDKFQYWKGVPTSMS
ncbi:oxidoreductase [Desmophyllum pertusum]|uniref:Oxidoreductase n=1 Tax=Desmophyllum pertusum TaxID=174260 RepID=A0A9W9ZFS9_9CNID|nr:oxidoreductase [Desmophyllum pertusum]